MAKFEIAIFKDRVSIFSPGHFPKPYTPEDYATGNYSPLPLNITISHILYLRGMIEEVSTGFERTFDLCEKNDVKYAYEDTSNGFRFEFYRDHKDPKLLNESEGAVLELIKDDPDIKVDELAKKSALSPRTIARSIAKLKKIGKLERRGSNKNGHWFLL